jgi:hypothetical protein
MRPNELHQNTAIFIRDMHDDAESISTKIKDQPVVAYEINSVAELPLDFRRCSPHRFAYGCEPSSDRSFSLRVLLPKLLQRAARDHLHDKYGVTKMVTRSMGTP